jgi:hypothetical protein
MVDGLNRDELRRLVREVLKQSLGSDQQVAKANPVPTNKIERMRQALLPGGSGKVEVTGDLTRFARDIVHAATQEDLKAAIMSGKLSFVAVQEGAPTLAPKNPRGGTAGTFNLNEGMLNELRVEEIGRQYARVVIGPQVVVTPLARDRARELKLELVRGKA